MDCLYGILRAVKRGCIRYMYNALHSINAVWNCIRLLWIEIRQKQSSFMRFILAIRFLQEGSIQSTLAAIYLGVSVWTSYDDGRFCTTFALCIRFNDLFLHSAHWNKSSHFLELFFFILFWYAYFCSFQLRCNWKSGLEVFDLKPIHFNISFELIIKSEFLEGNDIIMWSSGFRCRMSDEMTLFTRADCVVLIFLKCISINTIKLAFLSAPLIYFMSARHVS